MTSRPLQGRRVFYLGAEGAHGRRVAVAMGEAGAAVGLVTLSRETRAEFQANSIANEFWAFGGTAVALTCDADDADELRASLDEASARLGGVDTIVADVPGGAGSAATLVASLAAVVERATEGRPDLTVVVLPGYGAAAEGLVRLVTRLHDERRARACAIIVGEDEAGALEPLMPQESFESPDIGAAVVSAIERGLSGVGLVLRLTSAISPPEQRA